MAKAKTKVETPEVEEVIETEETTDAIIRPVALAKELDVDPKTLRGFLRRTFPRATEAKNTSWSLTPEMVAKATAHFTKADDAETEDDES